MRLGWAAGPANIIAVLSRGRTDSLRNTYTAALAEWFISTGQHREHIDQLRDIYSKKCAHMLAALEREMPDGTRWTSPNGGFFLWVTLPDGVDAVELQPIAQQNLVDYIPGTSFFSDGSGRNALRLSYSAVSEEEIDTGVARLAHVIREAM